jgi:integrase
MKGKENMTRQSCQQGHVSDPILTRHGIVFRIRYRIPTADGKWIHKCETLVGLRGKKQARIVLNQRIRESENKPVGVADPTLADFTHQLWLPYLERKQIKPSTKRSYESSLKHHVMPMLGNLRILDVRPLHIDSLVQSTLNKGSSPKTVRNLLGLLQGIFSLAVDNELIPRCPIRDSHWPAVNRREKPVWTPAQLKSIVDAVPDQYRGLFQCVMLTAVRLGELLGLQWRNVDVVNCKLEIRQALWEGVTGAAEDRWQ